jgi:CubicO group peptidase (beta-lactamase class C family)
MEIRSRLGLLVAGIALLVLTFSAAAELEKVVPEQLGLSSERLDRIGAVVQPYVAQKQIAGAVIGVVRYGKLAYLRSFGAMDLEFPRAMRDDAIFRIASMTKPITSTAVMMLYEDGKLLLDDPVSKYIPEFKAAQVLDAGSDATAPKTVAAKREITILDLLTHTSGITYRFWNKKPIAEIYERAGVSDGLSETPGTIGDNIKKLAKLPLNNQPGEAYEYGLNNDVLGYLIEVVSGMPLDKFFKERIFEPLRMKDTQFYVSADQRQRLVTLYTAGKEGGLVKASEQPTRWDQLIFTPSYPYSTGSTYFSGGAGLTSTVMDYLRFCQMLLNGGELEGARLLSPKAVELMATNHIGKMSVFDYVPAGVGNLGDKYGLGFGIRSEAGQNELGSVGEYMWAGIFNTRFWIDPKEHLAIVMMSQVIPRKPEIETKVHAAVFQAIMQTAQRQMRQAAAGQ